MTSRRSLVVAGTVASALSAASVLSACGSRLRAAAGPSGSAGWETAAAPALAALLDASAAITALRAVVVVHRGVLVGERYHADATAADLRPINSATKSVVGLLVGQALAQGRIAGTAQTVRELLPDAVAAAPASAAADVTLEQILTGRSGLAYDFVDDARLLAAAADPVDYALGRPADGRGRAAWSYNDAAVSLLSPILARAHGLPLEAVAERDLFRPLGIERFAWQRDRRGRALAWAGLRLPTRDLAKLAWLAVDAGRWRGASVVPPAWIDMSTRPQVAADWRVAPVVDIGYGRLWFTGTLAGRRIAWAWGYGAQFALAVPELGLAIATAAVSPPPAELAAQNRAVMGWVAQVVDHVARGLGAAFGGHPEDEPAGAVGRPGTAPRRPTIARAAPMAPA